MSRPVPRSSIRAAATKIGAPVRTAELPNLLLVCLRHHWLLHEGGWTIVLTDDRRVLTIPPLPEAPHAWGLSPPTADDDQWREQHRPMTHREALHPDAPTPDGAVPPG